MACCSLMNDTLNHGTTSETDREAHREKEGNNQGKTKKKKKVLKHSFSSVKAGRGHDL